MVFANKTPRKKKWGTHKGAVFSDFEKLRLSKTFRLRERIESPSFPVSTINEFPSLPVPFHYSARHSTTLDACLVRSRSALGYLDYDT